jgi:hypothetical protein
MSTTFNQRDDGPAASSGKPPTGGPRGDDPHRQLGRCGWRGGPALAGKVEAAVLQISANSPLTCDNVSATRLSPPGPRSVRACRSPWAAIRTCRRRPIYDDRLQTIIRARSVVAPPFRHTRRAASERLPDARSHTAPATHNDHSVAPVRTSARRRYRPWSAARRIAHMPMSGKVISRRRRTFTHPSPAQGGVQHSAHSKPELMRLIALETCAAVSTWHWVLAWRASAKAWPARYQPPPSPPADNLDASQRRSMVRWSCSLPQTLKLGVQAEMKPFATAVPFLNALPDCAVTITWTV